jgi:hypothetical protein
LVLIFSLSACGGGDSSGNPDVRSEVLTVDQFLYTEPKAKTEYHTEVSAEKLQALISIFSNGNQPDGYQANYFKVIYENTNLPQNAIHITNSKNTKLLIYNHGHGGLPVSAEVFAKRLIQISLDQGFDILLTSMPLVGLNSIDDDIAYWANMYGSSRPAILDKKLISPWAHAHGVYEAIDDHNHYMHFFIDSAVIFASLTSSVENTLARRFFHVNAPAAIYDRISYVGLSGGAATGLTACAVFAFDKCILVAGLLPFYLRAENIKSWGDAEQVSRSFYSMFSYEYLMQLAGNKSNKVLYIYNRHDPCCYADPEATKFQRDFPQYDIRVVDSDTHGFDELLIMSELSQD